MPLSNSSYKHVIQTNLRVTLIVPRVTPNSTIFLVTCPFLSFSSINKTRGLLNLLLAPCPTYLGPFPLNLPLFLCNPCLSMGIAPSSFEGIIPFTMTNCFLSFPFIFSKLHLFPDRLISLKPRKQNPLNLAGSLTFRFIGDLSSSVDPCLSWLTDRAGD